MKQLSAIIFAVMLSISMAAGGASAVGISAGAARADRTGGSATDMPVLSQKSEQLDEKTYLSADGLRAGAQRCFVDADNDGVCDHYADRDCPQNGEGGGNRRRSGQCHGNGTCRGNGQHRRNGVCRERT